MGLTRGLGIYLRNRNEHNKKLNSCVIASRRHLLHLHVVVRTKGLRGRGGVEATRIRMENLGTP